MKRILSLVIGLLFAQVLSAQPANYYNSANGLTGNQLKVALHNIVKGHTSITYSQLWSAFWTTDNKGNGIVWDMYSDLPNGTPPYTYQMSTDQCGSYDSEGDCYNREHSWPSSWFNDQSTPRTDLHHIFPTDGYVNNRRSNNAFGEVRSASWTSRNGSKLGPCKTSGFSGTVFEPIDAYKGDFARAIMYMSVRYYSEDSGWGTSDMTTKSEIKPWAIQMLLRWNELDPVSQKEIDRNNAIYTSFQHNRNPFVDHPEYARMIWDPTWNTLEENKESVSFYPNPIEAGQTLHLVGALNSFESLDIYDLSGRKVFKSNLGTGSSFDVTLPDTLTQGCYIVKLTRNGSVAKYGKLLVR